MRKLVVIFVFAALVTAATVANATVTLLEEERIRCKVCDRAIAHIWKQGVELRKHCKLHNTDPRCDNTNLHKHGIDEMVRDVCDDLPKTHQALMHSEFEFFVHDNPTHEPEVLEAVKNACVRWVHETNSIVSITRFMYANLDAGKSAQAILHPLQRRFCRQACTFSKQDSAPREDL